MKTKFYILIFITFSFYDIYAQQVQSVYKSQIDSVQTLLNKTSKSDTLQVIALNHLARLCIYDYQYEKGLKAAIEARELAQRLGYPQGEGLYLSTLDVLHYDDWMETPYHILAHWYFENIKRSEPKIVIKTSSQKNYTKRNIAIEKASLYFEQSEHPEIAAHLYYLSAFNDFSNEKFEVALKNVEKAELIFLHLKLDVPLVESKILKARIFKQLGKNAEVRNEELQMVKIGEEHKDERRKTLLYDLIGIYFYNNTPQIEISLDYCLKGVHILENLNEKYFLARIYYYTGIMFHFSGFTPISVEYLDKSFALIQSENINDLFMYGFYNFYPSRLIEVGQFEKAEKIIEIGKINNNYRGYGVDHQGMILMAKSKYNEALEKFYEKTALSGIKRGEPSYGSWIDYHIAYCLSRLGKLNESNRFAIASYQQDLTRNSRDSELQKTCLLLYENYEKLGQSKKALEYLKIYAEALQKGKELDIANRATKLELQEVINKSEQEKSKLEREKLEQEQAVKNQRWWLFSIAAGLFSSLVVVYLLFRNNKNRQKAHRLLQKQKEEINTQKDKAESALSELKSTQSQLIQSEKMASLGELTAGIAHEIQNPLNFVNNFSEVNSELIEELKSEKAKGKNERDEELEDEILNDIQQNTEKINHHGLRASGIVKGMLEHSRTSNGKKELTDINALANEYLRLAYHGLRAKDNTFNADFKTEFDEKLPKIHVIPQDIGRVLLNLINNAFYAVDKKAKSGMDNYKPEVIVSTKKQSNSIEISVQDNGNGIPDDIKDKIFQPFFTTKPTGSGTGLGLSLSYDIVKAHGGELKVETKEGGGSEFIIIIPYQN